MKSLNGNWNLKEEHIQIDEILYFITTKAFLKTREIFKHTLDLMRSMRMKKEIELKDLEKIKIYELKD